MRIALQNLNLKRYNLQWIKFRYNYQVFWRRSEKRKMITEFYCARAKLKRMPGAITLRTIRTYSRAIRESSECLRRCARWCRWHSMCVYKESDSPQIVLPPFMPISHALSRSSIVARGSTDIQSERSSNCSDDIVCDSENEGGISEYEPGHSADGLGPY